MNKFFLFFYQVKKNFFFYLSQNNYPPKREFEKLAQKYKITTENVINWFKQRRRKDFLEGKLISNVLKHINNKLINYNILLTCFFFFF